MPAMFKSISMARGTYSSKKRLDFKQTRLISYILFPEKKPYEETLEIWYIPNNIGEDVGRWNILTAKYTNDSTRKNKLKM